MGVWVYGCMGEWVNGYRDMDMDIHALTIAGV